jgi:hypothetical protein
VVLNPPRAVSQCLPEEGDVLREGSVADERVGPELTYKFFLRNNVTTIGNKNQQSVEDLRRERYQFAGTVEQPVGGI